MSTHVVKLGVMPPLTGVVGLYGSEIVRAAQIACAEVNEQGGVLGRPLELLFEDDGSLPESAVTAAVTLADRHGCAAIVGNLLSNSRIAVAYRVAEPRKLPYLNFSFYEGSIQSRYFFHFAALPNQQIDRMIPYMRERFGPRMFFAGNNYEWPRGSIDAGKRALLRAGGEVLGEEYTPIGVAAADIDRLLDQVAAAAPDVFVPYFAGADQVTLLSRFTERGMKSRIAVVMGHYDEMMASKLAPEVRAGFFSSNTYFMTVDTPQNRAYLQRLATWRGVTGIWPRGNGILTNFGEGTYVCVKAFAKAANLAGSLDAEALTDALGSIAVSGLQGEVCMDPATHHARVNTYLSRCNAEGVFEIVERFGAVDPVLPERYGHQQVGHQAAFEDDIRLQARMLEQMAGGVMLIGMRDRTILYANAGAGRIFGHDRSALIGAPLSSLDTATAEPHRTDIAIVAEILVRKGSWQGELLQRRGDGISIWCSASFSTFTHPLHGEVWLAVYGDITERKRAEAALEASVTEKETLLREIHHRVKNNLQIISSLLHFQSRKVKSPENLAVFQEGRDRLKSMILVHEKLYQSRDLSRIEFGDYARALIEEIGASYRGSAKAMTLKVQAAAVYLPIETALPLGMLLSELATNVYKYAHPDGRGGELRVTVAGADGQLRLTVADDGGGLPESVNPEAPESFGMQLVANLAAQLDGTVRYERGAGLRVVVGVPMDERAREAA